MIRVCVWHTDTGWLWDDAEDHGGFDRISPQGPHASRADAEADARARFAGQAVEIVDQEPAHYAEFSAAELARQNDPAEIAKSTRD